MIYTSNMENYEVTHDFKLAAEFWFTFLIWRILQLLRQNLTETSPLSNSWGIQMVSFSALTIHLILS